MARETASATPGGRTASIEKMYIFALAGDLPWPLCRLQAEVEPGTFSRYCPSQQICLCPPLWGPVWALAVSCSRPHTKNQAP